MIARIRKYLAQRKLARMLEQRRSTFQHQDYVKRSNAARRGRV